MKQPDDSRTRPGGRLRFLVGGLYAWVVTLAFGMTVLDVLYANSVPDAAAGFSEQPTSCCSPAP